MSTCPPSDAGCPDVIQLHRDGYLLHLEGHEFDVRQFSTLVARAGRRLAQGRFRDAGDISARAARLWRAEPYPELADVEVARGERDRLVELLIAARTTQARALNLQGRVSESIALLRQLVAEQPLNESLWEELVLAYSMAGRAADARATLKTARETLDAELAVTPGPRLQALETRVHNHDPALLDSLGANGAHNVPFVDSSFVGREDDLAAVSAAADRHHLVTITGPPGIGKTRLAIELGSRRLDAHPAGVWLVRLAGTRTEADVLSTITSALAVDERVDDLDELYRLLAPRPAVIIIDNCEHVIDAVRRLLGTRLHGDRVRILATSRSRLGIAGETIWPLRPLTLPEVRDHMWESATLQMLADRVRAADPTFDLRDADADELIALCRRTGGMPLAVELAAHRVVSLGLRRAAGLTFAGRAKPADTGEGDAGPRHEGSVADAIARSVALLDTVDRQVLAMTAVFVDTFAAGAFGNVCVGTDDPRAIDDTLCRLVEASLLVPERARDGSVRYRMLEPVRDFGLRRLTSSHQARAARDRHADWFVAAARATDAAAFTSTEATALNEVEASIADYRIAMRHLLDTDRAGQAAEIAAGLAQFWISRFLASEGQRWLRECLSFASDDASRIDILAAASGMAFFVGHYDESAAMSAEVRDLAIRLGDRRREARGLYGMGRVQIHRRPSEGVALINQAISKYEAAGDRVNAAECRVVIGMQAAYAADRDLAEAILIGATAFLEAEDYPRIASVGHRHLSLAAWHDDDEAAAREHLDRALILAERANDRRVRSGALAQRGLVEAKWGEPAEAARAIVAALDLTARQHAIYFVLNAFGALPLLIDREAWQMAAQLLDQFDRVHREYGWIPLDDRNAATPGYRARIAAGLAATGDQPELSSVSTTVFAGQLVEELRLIAGQS